MQAKVTMHSVELLEVLIRPESRRLIETNHERDEGLILLISR
jgi:hypothetical protein